MDIRFPNILVVTDDSSTIFFDDKGVNCKVDVTDIRWIEKYIPRETNSAIVSLSTCEPEHDNYGISLSGCISMLKDESIKKINFYLADVFRTSLSPMSGIDFSCEGRIINKIIDECGISEYNVYHCEKIRQNTTVDSLFNKTIYMDLFLIEQSQSEKYKLINRPNKMFTSKISCLNNRFEKHRLMITTLLHNVKDTFVTFNDLYACPLPSDFNEDMDAYMKYFSTKDQNKIKDNYKSLLSKNSSNQIRKNSLNSETQHGDISILYTQSGFVNLVTETTFDVPHNYISEKTLKPMFTYRPFILVAPQGTLSLLKDMGFKTFDKWWDESYDDETDPSKRMSKIFEISKYILNKSYEELNNIYDEMETTLIYNREQLEKIPSFFLKSLNKKIS
jgi:hypothetical protein